MSSASTVVDFRKIICGCKSFRVSLKCAEDPGFPHVFRDLQLACLVLSHRRRWLIFLANGRKMDAHTMS